MKKEEPTPQGKNKKQSPNGRNLILLILVIFGITYMIQWASMTFEKAPQELSYKDFYHMLKNNRTNEQIVSAVQTEDKIKGKFLDGRSYTVNINRALAAWTTPSPPG